MTTLGCMLFGFGFFALGLATASLHFRAKLEKQDLAAVRLRYRHARLRAVCLAKGMDLRVIDEDPLL